MKLIGKPTKVAICLGLLGLAATFVVADVEQITGQIGEPIDAEFRPHNSHLGPGSIDIVPASPTVVGNCIPFGNNTTFGFTGFVYRNVPAFELVPGCAFAFDLGRQNNVDVRRNIYFAIANINPAPAVVMGFNIAVSQGITALAWTQVVSDSQIPQNSTGNNIQGDYELIYSAEAPFSFPGGGLVVGFGGSPPGAFADGGCDQVLVQTTPNDASGFFYCRFFNKPDQTLGVLDVLTGGSGNACCMGGIVIARCCEPVFDPDVHTQGFWKRICAKPHPSGEDQNLPDYVDCVNSTVTFEDVDSVQALCDRLHPDPKNDKCEQAEAQFMALLLNVCSGRVETCNCIDDPALGQATVGEAIDFIDALLSDPARTHADCVLAQSIADFINIGLTLVDCP